MNFLRHKENDMNDIQVKVLVVEDDIIISEDIQRSLDTLGYEVIGAMTSGEEALNLIQKNPPDIVLMDIVLRGQLNGIDTAKMIYEQYHIPVVFLTAYSDSITLERANQAHHYGYICKPFEREELKEIIRSALDLFWEDQEKLES